MKRFYNLVSISNVYDGYHILLDSKPIKTKSGKFLCAPNKAIAMRVLQEWSDQLEEINPDLMPFTQILNTKLDRVSIEREAMTNHIIKYIDTDLVCYFAGDNDALIDAQKCEWQIWLDWFEKEFDHALQTTTGLAALKQNKRLHDVVGKYICALDDDKFTILQIIASVSGSLILAMALVNRVASASQIFDSCFIEENFKDKLYNAEKYGADPSLEKEQKASMCDFNAAQDYIDAL